MGQNHYKYNNNYELEIDDELKEIINQELNIIDNKNELKKFKKLIKRKIGNNFKRSNFTEKFNENGKGLKNISDLLNAIYDKNIDIEQKIKSNRTYYEILFDVRDAVELIDVNNEQYIDKKNNYDKFKKKINSTIETLLNPKNKNINQINNFNYDNDMNEDEKLTEDINIKFSNDIKNNDIKNINEINNDINEINENNENNENNGNNDLFINNNNNIIYNNKLIIQNNNNNIKPKTPDNSLNKKNIIYINNNKLHLQNNKVFKNIKTYNNEKDNNYNYNYNNIIFNNNIEQQNNKIIKTPNNDNNINQPTNLIINNYSKISKQPKNNYTKNLTPENNKKKGFSLNNNNIYNNGFDLQKNQKINNIKTYVKNKSNNNNPFLIENNSNDIKKTQKYFKNKIKNIYKKNIIHNNSFNKKIKENNNPNNLIYNKKNINKKIRTYSCDINNNRQLNDEDKRNNNNNSILKEEKEITFNIKDKDKDKNKEKNKDENKFKEICKAEEIFIEKSPNKVSKSPINSLRKKHNKKMGLDYRINKKYFTVRNEINNNANNNHNNNININTDNLNGKKYKNIYLKTETYNNNKINKADKTNNIIKSNIKKNNKKLKDKNLKHSKMPKKQPVINIQIDLKDLIKQEKMEKCLDNSKKIEDKPKKTKEYFDYPEDLKYNVFGKQYKFSYNDK